MTMSKIENIADKVDADLDAADNRPMTDAELDAVSGGLWPAAAVALIGIGAAIYAVAHD
jgi:lactobin A/cerein 7B family class IIb bacteriocin